LDQREGFIGYSLEEVEIIRGAEDEIMDSVKAAVGAKVETELLEAAGGQGAAVWGCRGVGVEIGEDFANSVCVKGVFCVVGPIAFDYFFYILEWFGRAVRKSFM
jgi:hypothetical protein